MTDDGLTVGITTSGSDEVRVVFITTSTQECLLTTESLAHDLDRERPHEVR